LQSIFSNAIPLRATSCHEYVAKETAPDHRVANGHLRCGGRMGLRANSVSEETAFALFLFA
jgi:hypothetical protein